MGSWTQADIDRIQARIGVGVRSDSPLAVGAGQTGETMTVQVRSKYRNVKIVVDGQRFDSKREAQRWIELTVRQKAGELRDLKRQVPIDLLAPGPERDRFIVIEQYLADFAYIDCRTDKRVIEDAKGKRTQMYLLKRKWLELQDGVEIIEV